MDQVDSEEYEEDEEEDRLRKKRKKDSRYGGFIIDEAEVRILEINLLLFDINCYGISKKHSILKITLKL